jgi:hypothetical protein
MGVCQKAVQIMIAVTTAKLMHLHAMIASMQHKMTKAATTTSTHSHETACRHLAHACYCTAAYACESAQHTQVHAARDPTARRISCAPHVCPCFQPRSSDCVCPCNTHTAHTDWNTPPPFHRRSSTNILQLKLQQGFVRHVICAAPGPDQLVCKSPNSKLLYTADCQWCSNRIRQQLPILEHIQQCQSDEWMHRNTANAYGTPLE